MSPARYVKQPRPQATNRSIADASLHAKCDSILKELRSCSRQISSIQSCLEDELRILERFYYKGVNQHRSALFWHKVEEIRRLGARLLEVQLLDLTDSLRYSFYINSDADRNPKILKSAWTQIPNVTYVCWALERTRSVLLLASKARERFAGAHRVFTLMLQTGAFLQFILVLTALVSRLDILIAELESILQGLDNIISKLVVVLGGKARSVRTRKKETREPLKPALQPARLLEVGRLEDLLGEDLGSSVVRRSPDTDPMKVTQEPQTNDSLFWKDTQTMDEDPPDHQLLFTKPDVIVTTASAQPVQTNGETGKSNGSTPIRKVKKKKKRDEIDDIFGSL